MTFDGNTDISIRNSTDNNNNNNNNSQTDSSASSSSSSLSPATNVIDRQLAQPLNEFVHTEKRYYQCIKYGEHFLSELGKTMGVSALDALQFKTLVDAVGRFVAALDVPYAKKDLLSLATVIREHLLHMRQPYAVYFRNFTVFCCVCVRFLSADVSWMCLFIIIFLSLFLFLFFLCRVA